MEKILIAYTTNAGSTVKVAQTIAEELGKDNIPVDVRRLEEVTDLAGYTAVAVGAPMILGWHRTARQFVKKHQAVLSGIPVAYFCTLMSLTDTGERSVDDIPIFVDPGLGKAPKNSRRLSYRENYASIASYTRPILNAAPQIKPISIGFFGGRLELMRLNLIQMLFVMLVVQAPPGDLHNKAAMREWASCLKKSDG